MAKRSGKKDPKLPDEASLRGMLGKAGPHWDEIIEDLDSRAGLLREWKFYGEKYGWQLKVTDGKRAVLYLAPRAGGFTAAMALKEKAVEALRASGLPAALIREIEGGKSYPEGKAARIDVTSAESVKTVRKLIDIKLSTQ